jgi:NAD(P)H-nitrite reductase large subunit
VAGPESTFSLAFPPAALAAFDTRIFSVGQLERGDVLERGTGEASGMRLYFEADVLTGAVLWGDTAKGLALAKALGQKADRAEVKSLIG